MLQPVGLHPEWAWEFTYNYMLAKATTIYYEPINTYKQHFKHKTLTPGQVARSDACLTGIPEVAGLILRSCNILLWRLAMKSFLRPFSPYS